MPRHWHRGHGPILRIYLILATLLCSAAPAQAQSAAYAKAAEVERDRSAIAAQLVEPIVRCVKRRDTNHDVFHGCIDWHSSVHGMLGLVLYGSISGDTRYDAFVEGQLDERKLALEQAMLARNPHFEMPYGRAWFLRLAIEHERRFGSRKLRGMTDEVAGSLKTFIEPRQSDLFEGSYDSISWALINLIDYARATENRALLDFAEGYARAALVRTGPRCSYNLEQAAFMSICLQRAWLASKVLAASDFDGWNRQFLKQVGVPKPVLQAASTHHHGLNFSRSWALAALFRKTALREYDAGFAAHFAAGYRRREGWDGPYETVAHWVAQFGMMALRLIGPDAPRR